jgi:hypothetical protein
MPILVIALLALSGFVVISVAFVIAILMETRKRELSDRALSGLEPMGAGKSRVA